MKFSPTFLKTNLAILIAVRNHCKVINAYTIKKLLLHGASILLRELELEQDGQSGILTGSSCLLGWLIYFSCVRPLTSSALNSRVEFLPRGVFNYGQQIPLPFAASATGFDAKNKDTIYTKLALMP